MKVHELVAQIEAARTAGALGDQAPTCVLSGFIPEMTGEQDMLLEQSIVDVEVDGDGRRVGLVVGAPSEGSSLTVSELIGKFKAMTDESLEYDVFAQDVVVARKKKLEAAPMVSVVAVAVSPEGGRFAVIPWFEGCEGMLGQ